MSRPLLYSTACRYRCHARKSPCPEAGSHAILRCALRTSHPLPIPIRADRRRIGATGGRGRTPRGVRVELLPQSTGTVDQRAAPPRAGPRNGGGRKGCRMGQSRQGRRGAAIPTAELSPSHSMRSKRGFARYGARTGWGGLFSFLSGTDTLSASWYCGRVSSASFAPDWLPGTWAMDGGITLVDKPEPPGSSAAGPHSAG